MGKRRIRSGHAARAQESDAFVAGAAGRPPHVTTPPTAETRLRAPYAHALPTAAPAHTCAVRDRAPAHTCAVRDRAPGARKAA